MDLRKSPICISIYLCSFREKDNFFFLSKSTSHGPQPFDHRAPAVSCGRVRQCWLSANSTILSSHAGPCPLAPSFRDLDCLPRTRNLDTGRGGQHTEYSGLLYLRDEDLDSAKMGHF